ncbi:MAG: pyridoxamine 5'-phosphate oxidase family protein [Chloroflexi bacterium]|nr:pyridoxamine 5'-phosphate oxidase family protein [Chloroflexota bacterium]MBV9543052.1 pyridoxamine 5'-phosphate oxidase family protein [Chloroflexota bacterium]
MTQPAAPPPLTFDLTRYADAVNTAFYNQSSSVCVVATSDGSDVDLALKGSFMVWDQDHLAYWERAMNETLAAIQRNPRVAVLVRPKGASPMRFYGAARVVDESSLRDAVYDRVIPEEQARDPEKKGVAVLIRVDRIRQGPQSISR